jgi:secreted trypsin-like serine protease
MKCKQIIFSIFSAMIFLTFFSGVIRHDAKEKSYLDLAKKKQFDCVGQVYKGTLASGSCVLISDRYILSAAHVFIDSDTIPDTLNFNGQTIVVYVAYNHRVTDIFNLRILIKGRKLKGKKLWIHPHYLDSLTKGSCDIAILELEKPLNNIVPAKLNSSLDELNSDVVGVGFGASGPADRPDLVGTYNKKIAGENVVDSIDGQEYMGFKTLLICDFDHPTRKDCNKIGSSIPRPLEYITSGGDSGGGLFRKNNKGWELIGICSRVNTDVQQFMKTGYYGQIMEWTRVSVFKKWIDEQKR